MKILNPQILHFLHWQCFEQYIWIQSFCVGEWGGCRVKWGKVLCMYAPRWGQKRNQVVPDWTWQEGFHQRFHQKGFFLIDFYLVGHVYSAGLSLLRENWIQLTMLLTIWIFKVASTTCKFDKQDKACIVSRVLWSISEVCKIWKRELKCWRSFSRVKVFLQGSPVFSYLPNIYLNIHSSGSFCSSS